MRSKPIGHKPRVTDDKTLQAIVQRLRQDGCEPDEIHRLVVREAVVDLDALNAVLRAA
ncbi:MULTISPECIES: hypothetical protein [Georhizobium]|jgi:hypothetical protein|uniref:hypothetical protein n=1 Tax=Georhizobium TaxID=2661800 RepID=UPI0013E0CE0A|nr:hypothetical protein [Georhizobium profundi]GLQ39306.1 hypothetical protein GCM10007908_29260 [Rhizobium albus]